MTVKHFDYLHDDAKAIRKAVFMDEQGFKNEFDDTDKDAIHIIIYSQENDPVGTCRVYYDDEDGFYVLGRLAVLKPYRRQNIGTALIHEAEKTVIGRNGNTLCLHAQCRAKDFYIRSGYTPFGEEDDDEGCPHIWMKKDLIG